MDCNENLEHKSRHTARSVAIDHDSDLPLHCPLHRADRAASAVASRLLSRLVTESLLKALFVPIKSVKIVGVCIVLSRTTDATGLPLDRPYRSTDIFAIIPLRALPIIKGSSHANVEQEITLVDPLDMLPYIYEVCENAKPDLAHGVCLVTCPWNTCDAIHLDLPAAILSSLSLPHFNVAESTMLFLSLDPLYIWKKFSTELKPSSRATGAITQELLSSVIWQSAF